MNWVVAVYTAILFFVLSPNVLLRLPPNGSKLVVAGVHAVVFATILYFTAGYVWRWSTFGLGSYAIHHKKEVHNDAVKPKVV